MGLATGWTLKVKVCLILVFIPSIGLYLSHFDREDVIQILAPIQYDEKQRFIEMAMQTTMYDPFDSQPMRDLCGNITWTEGLIFKCDSPQGGVGNVQNFFVNCFRFAIEAGGRTLTLPPTSRNLADIAKSCLHRPQNHDPLANRPLTPHYQRTRRLQLSLRLHSLYHHPLISLPPDEDLREYERPVEFPFSCNTHPT